VPAQKSVALRIQYICFGFVEEEEEEEEEKKKLRRGVY